MAHYRVSDMTGPNGEKVLYVDEIQSDWHQQARDVRKEEIKRLLEKEKSSIRAKALDELEATKGNTLITTENEQALKVIQNRLTRERKAELEKQVDENFGYSKPGDDDKLYKLNSEMERLRNTGMTLEEIEKYYTPGKIVPSGRGLVKVLSFNSAENSPRYKQVYDEYYQRNMNIGVGEEAADRNARKNALEKSRGQWSVTTVDLDLRGNPRGNPSTHSTSPEQFVVEDLRKEARAIESKKPDAPFKKNWHELAVKDILDLAAKEGYDKVAFAPGIEQVKRYERDLRKAIDKIEYVPTEDGSLVVNGIKGGRTVFNGKVVDGTFVNGAADGKTLSEVFGSSIAKQIEEEAPALHEAYKSNMQHGQVGKIEGDNLTIGGEGMKSFYDQRLPSFVKNYAGKEFKAPTGYMEFEGPSNQKTWTPQQFRDEMNEIENQDNVELMEMVNDLAHTRAEEALARRGITPDSPGHYADWDEALWDEIDNHMDAANDQAVRVLAQRNLEAKAGKTPKIKAFSVDITPEMKEKITTQGQKLYAAAPAAGLGAAQVQQKVAPAPEPAPEEQPQTSPEVPQAFQSGGKVGSMKDAAEAVLRVLHGSPTKVRLDAEKNLDVTTDPSYAMKRARDKMDARGIEGPPMVNKFDVPAAKMLRFEETYSPEDVAKMKRFYSKLPEGKAMTGEEIYDATGGKDYVLEGLARAGGFSGYQRPAGGSGGIGDWYRVTDQEALIRKARGGFIHGYADGGGKVDLTRRGLLGLRGIFAGPTENLPAVIPKAPLAEIAKEVPAESKALAPIVAAPLAQLVQKVVETPMSRRDVLKRAGQAAINQALPTPKVTDVVEQISPLKHAAEAQQLFQPNPEIDNVLRSALSNVFEDATNSEPFAAVTSAYGFMRDNLEGRVDKKELAKYDKLNARLRRYYDEDNEGDRAYDVKEQLEQFIKDKMELLKPHEISDVHSNFMQDEDLQLLLENASRYDPEINKSVPKDARTKDLNQYIKKLTPQQLENYLDQSYKSEKRVNNPPRTKVVDDSGVDDDYEDYISGIGGE